MAFSNVIAVALSFIAALLYYGAVTIVLMFWRLSLGWESLEEIKTQSFIDFLILLFLAVPIFLILTAVIKARRHFVVIFTCVPVLLAFCVTLYTYFGNRITLDKAIWMQSHPFAMAKKLYEDEELLGLSKSQIVEKLGPGRNKMTNSRFQYVTTEGWMFSIVFKNDTVNHVSLRKLGYDG